MKKWIVLSIPMMIGIGIVGYFMMKKRTIPIDNTNFTIKQETLEVYEEILLSDMVVLEDGYILENVSLDTTSLGVHQVEFLYTTNKKKKRKGQFSYTVVDTTKPIILLSNAYSVYVGDDKALTDVILSADNYDKTPTREIVGEYNMNQVGSYSLVYRVTDASGNVAITPFNLYVLEKPIGNSNEIGESSYTSFQEIVTTHKTNSTKIGIDVSKWQGEIDFERLKQAGVEFVIIRVGTGLGFQRESIVDVYFKRNIEEAIRVGIPVGIYYYSYATTNKEAKEQANWVIEQIKPYKIDLPIAFDWESWVHFNGQGMSIYDINEVAQTFLDTIEKAGYSSILYGSKYYLQNIWKTEEPVWLAHYTAKTNYDKKYKLWQLCENGKVDGIKGYVDIDILYE